MEPLLIPFFLFFFFVFCFLFFFFFVFFCFFFLFLFIVSDIFRSVSVWAARPLAPPAPPALVVPKKVRGTHPASGAGPHILLFSLFFFPCDFFFFFFG